jgi:hypothetical protein
MREETIAQDYENCERWNDAWLERAIERQQAISDQIRAQGFDTGPGATILSPRSAPSMTAVSSSMATAAALPTACRELRDRLRFRARRCPANRRRQRGTAASAKAGWQARLTERAFALQDCARHAHDYPYYPRMHHGPRYLPQALMASGA